jgi:1,4-dihydroxy-2-naphthoate octaprenyltransferase
MTLVDKKISPAGCMILSIVCYLVAALALSPFLTMPDEWNLKVVFATGIVLAFFYTAKPVGLKYMALGDITIFLCFGPLLMQARRLRLSAK